MAPHTSRTGVITKEHGLRGRGRTAPHASRMADSELRGQPAAEEAAAPGPRPAQGASAAREAGCGGGARLMGSAARWTKSVHAWW